MCNSTYNFFNTTYWKLVLIDSDPENKYNEKQAIGSS